MLPDGCKGNVAIGDDRNFRAIGGVNRKPAVQFPAL
jgi:hypothetical protein